MTSDRQIAANRRNAQRSTGPKTSKGKAVSSQNARRHGVLSDRVTALNENSELFNSVLLGLIDDFAPRSEMELVLVERLAVLIWRERRLISSEKANIEQINSDVNFTNPAPSIHDQLLVGRYQTMLTNQIASTLMQLERLQNLWSGSSQDVIK
ncbi:MAG: hypothetical protein ABGW84_10915 [Sphingomonadaceae bacterium]